MGFVLSATATDRLVLKNNDLLEGELRRIGKGILVFCADVGGTLMVPVDQVRSLKTEGVYEVAMTDGSLVTGRFDTDDSRFYVVPQGSSAQHGLKLAEVAEVTMAAQNSPAVSEPEQTASEDTEQGSSGSIRLGLRAHAGEEDYVSPLLGASLQLYGRSLIFTGDAAAALDDAGGFPRYYNLAATWELRPLQPVAGLIEAELRRETSQGLDLEAMVALSAERRFRMGESGEFGTALGLDYTYQAYDSQPLYDDDGLRESARQVGLVDRYAYENDLNLRIQLRYSQQIFAKGTFESRLLLQPSLSDLGELRGRAGSRVAFPLYDDLLLQVDLRVDYDDHRPFATLDPWQTSLEASLGWRF
jgi:hypothetical protein